jgi:Skp family chaperone for outer membrane proteins
LTEITEEELRKKSPDELQSLIKSLHIYHPKIHEQANYWLDAKEQLVMDAETHNKVIASLVQYAQQQQQAPKGK